METHPDYLDYIEEYERTNFQHDEHVMDYYLQMDDEAFDKAMLVQEFTE